MKKKENSERYNSFMIALVVIISISFIYMYYAFVVSPTGLASFNETSGETNFPPVWSYNETVFRINKNAALVLNLDDYFSDQENDVLSYLATQPSSFSVVIEGNILTAQPEQNFFGERDMIISASDDYNLVSQEVRIIVEETSASFNEGASIQDKDNKFVGKKVVDEVEFETYFNYIVKNETGLFLSFYHDSLEPQPVWIEGNVSYELSQNVSLLNENVTLVVFRNNDVVPKFKLHVGVTSEIFEFGKEIPEVSINEGVAHSIVNFSFIDRDDELLDVAVSQRVAHALIKGINVSEVRVMIGESSETVLNTEVFAAEPIDMESAEISLPKNSDINAIMECTDFDLDSFSCNGLWINSGLSFTQNETHIFFTVSHFSGYGGADIEILTVQSYPMVGSIWTVAFNVSGTANLTITAEEDTVFGTDLIFLSLMCGDDVVDASYDGTTVFYENFNCSTTAYEKSTVLTEGRHVLKFLFGEEEDYAYNSAYSGTNSLSTANHSFHGEASGDMAGYSVAPGDFNGDGIKDLLIGAPGYNSGGTTHAGKAYVVLGPFPRYSWNLSNANASWIGANASDEAGWSVAAGDINGDSYDDVIIGAPGYDYDTGPFPATRGLNVGRVYLFYGSEDISGNYNLSNVSGANGFNASFMGQNQSDAAGWSLAVGELSGDTEEDIVVGAYLFQDSGGNQLGRVYSVFGAPGLYGNFELADANASFIGESAADWFGYSMAIGDVTGDTKNDLIIGAPKFDKPVMADEGRVYIQIGRAHV